MPSAHVPLPGRAGGPAEVTLRLAQDRDRIAEALNDIVIHRIFSAGLALETALGLLDSRRSAAAKIQDALGELDLAIRDVRNVLFDHHQPDPRLAGRQPRIGSGAARHAAPPPASQ